jgi:hypothetical protein
MECNLISNQAIIMNMMFYIKMLNICVVKYVNYEFRDISGEYGTKDRLDVERFNEYFYSEKEIRKIKLEKLNYEQN